MKKMIWISFLVSALLSCGKDVMHLNYLPGDWQLIRTELYEQDSLKAIAEPEAESILYRFNACGETGSEPCTMSIEEDGTVENYPYTFDQQSNTLILGSNSVFEVREINETDLYLAREYDDFTSTYQFVRSD